MYVRNSIQIYYIQFFLFRKIIYIWKLIRKENFLLLALLLETTKIILSIYLFHIFIFISYCLLIYRHTQKVHSFNNYSVYNIIMHIYNHANIFYIFYTFYINDIWNKNNIP